MDDAIACSQGRPIRSVQVYAAPRVGDFPTAGRARRMDRLMPKEPPAGSFSNRRQPDQDVPRAFVQPVLRGGAVPSPAPVPGA